MLSWFVHQLKPVHSFEALGDPNLTFGPQKEGESPIFIYVLSIQ